MLCHTKFYVFAPNRKWLHNTPPSVPSQFLLLTSPYTLERGKFIMLKVWICLKFSKAWRYIGKRNIYNVKSLIFFKIYEAWRYIGMRKFQMLKSERIVSSFYFKEACWCDWYALLKTSSLKRSPQWILGDSMNWWRKAKSSIVREN